MEVFMTIRMTGIASGLDTDSIISELMSAQRTKIETIEKKYTKLEWKDDAWSTLNSKIYSLYTGTISEMRFTSNYNKKTTSISDSSIATVTPDSSAVDGTNELEVNKLAKSGYLTGGELSTSDSSTLSSSTTLSQLTGYTGTGDGTFQITVGSADPVDIDISGDSTISSVISQLKSAGVNASFDSTNGRIFVSSEESGADANFTISCTDTSDTNGINAMSVLGLDSSATGTGVKIEGQDAEIVLNGATFTSSNNAFSINGLNIVAKELTDSPVSISTSQDYQGIYDTIKNFFTEYNTLINEMDSLYNADSSSGYEPLTDDEKDAMTDTQIEDWETKIKDSLLRNDSTLSSVSTAMKSTMSSVFAIDGTNYSLASFGIATGGYFTTDDNEHNAYHIDGDSDDSTVSGNTDKLMSAITSDPDTVMSFFMTLSKGLYSEISSEMSSVDGVSSAFTVYNDKTISTQMDDYEDEIDELEEKFTDMEDAYYSQFTAMETALTLLQSESSALSSLTSS
jgi:flagellar hook-associated protein 2